MADVTTTTTIGVATDFEEEVLVNSTTVSSEETGTSGYICDHCVNIAYVIIGLLGVLGNLLVIVILKRNHEKRNEVTKILIINQSALDMTSAALQSISRLVFLLYEIKYNFRGAELVCRLFTNQVFMWDTLVSSTYNLIALNLDRYFQIVHPIIHKVHFTPKRVKVVARLIWLIGLCINMYAMFTSGVRDEKCVMNSIWPAKWVAKMVGLVKLILQFFLPVAVMIYSYVRILITIRRRSFVVAVAALRPPVPAAQAAAITAKHAKNISTQKNIFKTLAIVTICFVLCWSWNQFFILLFYFEYPVAFDTVYYRFSVFMVLLNCSCNPVIYTFSYEPFRQGIKSLVRGKEHSHTTQITSTSGHHAST